MDPQLWPCDNMLNVFFFTADGRSPYFLRLFRSLWFNFSFASKNQPFPWSDGARTMSLLAYLDPVCARTAQLVDWFLEFLCREAVAGPGIQLG